MSPRKLHISIAFTSSLFLFVALSVTGGVHGLFSYWALYLIWALIQLLLVFWMSTYLNNRFYAKTIKPIYKTIRSVSVTSKSIREDLENPSFNTDLERDVKLWAKEKTRQIAQLRQMEKYRKEFIGNVSHELKTPIFTIQGYISTLIDGGIDDPTINKKYLLKTEKSIDRMISIVEDLISISKLESGELTLNQEWFSIDQLVKEVIEMQEERANKKEVNLYYKPTEGLSYTVYGDKRLLYQVLTNLVTNSLNYNKVQGFTKIKTYSVDKVLHIEVSDNGIGIPEQDLPRIFERFYRVDKSRSKDQGGTGLGLAICKHIIEAHGQSINVSSQVDFGSTFTFTLNHK